MIKVVYCFRKRWGLTDEEFHYYWKHVHGPLGARIPGLRRLVQSQPLYEHSRSFDYDGIAELWFDDMNALEAARRSPEWARSSADEALFIDADTTSFCIVQETEITPRSLLQST